MLSRWRDHFDPEYWFERQPWQVKGLLIGVPFGTIVLVAAVHYHALQALIAFARAIGEAGHGK
jgi:hypothetical protein